MMLAGGMTRRTFLKTIGIASGSLAMATQLARSQARAGQADAPTFQLRAAEPQPKLG
jgi:phosphodiesterase/alkaline phosphatase D-like protein